MFPAEAVPDGSVAVSHHATWALVMSLIPLMVVWDNHPTREPWLAVSAVTLALLGFLIVWPTHPVLGAALTVAATGTALVALTVRAADLPDSWGLLPVLLALALVLVATDDVVDHAFHVQTPLDWVWNAHLRPRLPSH
jgi:uncharacterized membrane protein